MSSNINFIKTPSPMQVQRMTQWYRISTCTIACCLLALISINVYQWYGFKSLGSPHQQLVHVTSNIDALTERIKKLTEQQQQLQQLQAKVQRHKLASFQPATYIRAIARAIPHDTCLYTADLHKKGFMHLTGYTDTVPSLQEFIQKLEVSDYVSRVHLSSLQPDSPHENTLYRFAIRATLQSGIERVE